MRKLVVLLWMIFLPTVSTIAQSNKEEQEIYNQLKEWAVVKLTIAYIEDLRGWTPETKNNNKSEFQTYIKLVNEYQNFSNEKVINLDSVGELLTNGSWSRTKINVFDHYNTLNIDSEFNFQSIQASGYDEKNSKQRFNETIIVLNKKYEELLNAKNNIEKGNIENSMTESLPEDSTDYTIKKTSESSSLLYWVLSILIIAIIFIFFFKKNKLKNGVNMRNDGSNMTITNHDSFNSLIEKLKNDVHHLKISEDRLNGNIQSLKREVKNLKMEVATLKSNLVSVNEYSTNDTPSKSITLKETSSKATELDVSHDKSSNLIYLPSPFQDLTFANEDASKDRTLNSLYMIEFNKQMKTGELSVLVDANLSKALNSPDTYLKTACIYDNDYSNNAKAIIVTNKGKIKLEGEDWIVTEKVRIKFI